MKKAFMLVLTASAVSLILAQAEYNLENTSLTPNSINTEKMDAKQIELQSFTQYEEVLKALEPYIESAKTGDGKLSRSAFLDHAHIVGSIDGKLDIQNADQFGEGISELGASNNIRHHVTWIDISGPAAAAKVEFVDWHGFRFTDFFVLYKNDDHWKISGKVYDSHTRN